MKRTAGVIGLCIFGFINALVLSGQCEPDTVNCKDTGDPGQICPQVLPDAGLNVLYDEVVTVIPPAADSVGNTLITIAYIVVDSVKNLPPGIDYFPNADIFFPDTAYCIQITGTPTDTGAFQLRIYVTVFVDILGTPVPVIQVADTTSVTLTVLEVLGIHPEQKDEFRVYSNVPNPFADRTRISYFSPYGEKVELAIYNMLGILVYEESVTTSPGEHSFRFDGGNLDPGAYLYRVSNGKRYITGRLVKTY